MPKIKLTAKNYHSNEANWEYMSASQFKAFRKCEAMAIAELRGEWERKDTTAILIGSYVDAYFSNELEQFVSEHPEIFKRDGTLKADFIKAHEIAKRLESDELTRMLLSGEHQVIKTGKIADVWFKAKFDSLLSPNQVEAICEKFPNVRSLVIFGGAIINDLKIMKDFEPIWDDENQCKASFINYWGYDFQGAIYQKLDGREAPFIITAATKESEPNIDAFYIPDVDLHFALAEVEAEAPRYAAIKRGEIAPIGCGKCEYCRSVKKLNSIKNYRTIIEEI